MRLRPVRTLAFVASLLLGLALEVEVAAAKKSETAVFAGGCFWGVEAVYEHVQGVERVVSGYAGGTRSAFRGAGPSREGYAEAVRITYDPARVSYSKLLEIFATVAHDPTQVDRQGPDVGPRYRSAIFPQSREQHVIAERFVANLKASGRLARPIATRVESGPFEVAEREHQDYVNRHPKSAYVVRYDLPKLAHLRAAFREYWRP